ncbi:hypothetical protein ACFX14_001207 [Malus domestica]
MRSTVQVLHGFEKLFASFLLLWKIDVGLVYLEEFGSHLVTMDSVFNVFFIVDREEIWEGFELVQPLFGVSESIIETGRMSNS